MSHDNASDLLARMQDAAIEDLMRASDDDIRKEAAEDGEDLQALAARFKEDLANKMAEMRRARLLIARERLDSLGHSQIQRRSRPPLQQLRAIVMDILRTTPTVGIAHRAGQRLTDEDVQSLYDDLVDVGAIKPSDEPG